MSSPLVQPLTAADRDALEAFLAEPGRACVSTVHALQGFFFPIASAPELIQPSEWLEALFDDGGAAYSGVEEANRVLGRVMAVYNDVAAAVHERERRSPFPPDCHIHDDALANLEEDAPVSQWSRGFMEAHLWLEELWDEVLPAELEEDFDSASLTLAFFASREFAEKIVDEAAFAPVAGSEMTIEEAAALCADSMGEAAYAYASIGRGIEEVSRAARQPRSVVSVGRNEPCPCGSGKKYKKCCGAPGRG